MGHSEFRGPGWDLLPFPHLRSGLAGGIDVVLEGGACVVESGELFGGRGDEEHAAVADGAARAEFAEAGAGPGEALALVGHGDALTVTEDGAVGPDGRGVGSHASSLDAEHLAGVLERHLCGGWIDGEDPADKSSSFRFAYLISEHGCSLTFNAI